MSDENAPSFPPKGVPMKFIKGYETIITNKESVLAFFRANREVAYSVEDLINMGFSSNIRKILNKLLNEEILERNTYYLDDRDKWQYIYYLSEDVTSYELVQDDNPDLGYKLAAMNFSHYRVPVECSIAEFWDDVHEDIEQAVLTISIDFEPGWDAVVYSNYIEQVSSDDDREVIYSHIGSFRYSEIYEHFKGMKRRITFEIEVEPGWGYDAEGWDPAKEDPITIIEKDELILWVGGDGFKFKFNRADLTLRITPVRDTSGEDGSSRESPLIDYVVLGEENTESKGDKDYLEKWDALEVLLKFPN